MFLFKEAVERIKTNKAVCQQLLYSRRGGGTGRESANSYKRSQT